MVVLYFLIGVIIGVCITSWYIYKLYIPRNRRLKRISKSVDKGYLTKRESIGTISNEIIFKRK